ncbi:MAG: DUF1349 domain-containing protein, partial [Actinomycetota bacterium]
VKLRSTSTDGTWQYEWDVFPRYARATVTRKGSHPYWFLYEGTPGGEIDTNDRVVRSTGVDTALSTAWTEDLPLEEWALFADRTDGRSIFLAQHADDTLTDSHYVMQNNMTVFGFGRNVAKMRLTAVPQSFTIGLLDATTHATGAPLVLGSSKDIVVAPGTAAALNPLPPAVITSDDFHPAPLDTAVWTYESPVRNDGSASSDGTRAVIQVPSGLSHDPWGTDRSNGITQRIPDADFVVEAKFESRPTSRFQIQGLIFKQNDANFVRFDFVHDGTQLKAFAASTAGGASTQRVSTLLGNPAGPLWLRVRRTGNTWAMSWSNDGTAFTSASSFSFPLTVGKAKIFAANHATSGTPPAFTALVDY